MMHVHDANSRRILTFPAIRPCESVSPATLLSSLITLSNTISLYKSKRFYTNAPTARDSLRLVGNILICLQDIPLPLNPSLLSLSELHFVFQKLSFLLEDCSRSDARVWMLAQSQKVSDHFRAIYRSICVALDVLPLDSLHVPIECKQVMCLVKNQASNSKIKIGVPPEDQRVLEHLRSVLDQLELQMAPDPQRLKRVLDYLGISSWSQCNNEINFLDSEISATKKSDLCSLMIYTRCTVFTVIDCDKTTTSGDTCCCCNQFVTSLNADDFRCPISLEIMSDPVTLATGHTYDRSSIEKWFRSGNSTCPKTGQKVKVDSGSLVSNLCIRSLIRKYCLQKGISVAGGSNRNGHGDIAVADHTGGGGIKMAVDFLADRLVFGSSEAKHKATYEIRLLSKSSVFNRACLVEAGVVPSLLDLICVRNPKIQENAIAALLNLSKYSTTTKVVVENGGLELILEVAQNGLKMEARQHAAGALFYLASVDDEYRDIIGKIPRSIPVLMELVLDGTDRCKKNALVAILGLLMYPENHWKALAAGIVPMLIHLLKLTSSSHQFQFVADSLAILATLAETSSDGAMTILGSGALPVILQVIGSTSSLTEYCVALLLAMCKHGGADVVGVLVSNSSLMGPLYSLLTQGTSHAKKKASSLIRILHEFNEKNASSPVHFQQHHFVDVW